MMNVEDFRIMFRAHLSHELWDKWRNGQLDVTPQTDANTRSCRRKRQIGFSMAGKSIPVRIWPTRPK